MDSIDPPARILIVEDALTHTNDLVHSLGHLGYEITGVVSSVREAVSSMKQTPPDLVFMGITLEGTTDGIAAAEQTHVQFGIPVVFVVAEGEGSIPPRARNVEHYGCLICPVGIAELQSTVETALCRHAVERRVRQRERRYRCLVEHSPEAIAVVNVEDAVIEYVNPRTVELSGFSREQFCEMRFQDFVHPEDLDIVAQVHALRQKGDVSPRLYECRLLRKDGGYSWVEVKSAAISWEGKSFTLVFMRDVTQRHEIERALRETGERYLQAVENSPNAICTLDHQGTILSWNQASERLTGLEKRSAIGQPIVDLVLGPRQAERIATIVRQVFRGDSLSGISLDFFAANGGIRMMISRAYPVRDSDGNVIACMLANTDVTDLRRAEEALRNSEIKYRRLFDNSPVGIISVDPSGGILEVNTKLLDILGSPSVEATKAINLLQFPALREAGFSGAFEECMKTGKPVSMEGPYTSKWGKRSHLRVLINPLMDDNHTVQGCQAVIEDVTDRKQAEDRLQTSLQEKEVLLREIHHRVKNNLAVISSLLSLQSRYSQGLLTQQAVQDLQHRIRSMALAHKRLYESKNLAKLQVADYLGSVVDDLVRTYSATGTFITVEKDIQDAAFSLDTAIPLGMLLTELVSNCMKHAFVNQLRGTVSVSLKPVEKGRFKLVVSDDGRGMPTYSPGDRPASMGLDLVDSFVRQLDATLDITVGSGTTVSLVFDPRMGRIPDV